MITNSENTNHLTTSEYRKTYFETNKTLIFPYACMELMNEYFEIKRDRFLKDAKEQLQPNYNQKNEIKIFIKKEIKEFKEYRNQKKEVIQNSILEKTREKISLKQKRYINFLKEQLIKLEQLNDSNSELAKEQLFEEQNKLIPKVAIKDVYNHFETLIKTTNKNNEFYLTNKQLLIFIKTTFIDLEPQIQDFNCKGFIKKNIRKVFFDFYFNSKNKESNQTSLKRKYFNIMNDAFNGFNENDYTDFAK
ncbi:hypothetical protein QLS71_007415 [Mariniflexile litorale]|uniref:Uncharacterized protein n=1 Tax=Mariniflexile litorale TaxID=3045158 RepID=A0AAU7EKT9_9FLAO|nr:hypothetical protein [Mariniflexile sp. KMM 9835]MDQ8211224.1 hypothetical protein [Mariniflexile sp. KMM 9835]